MKNDGNFIVLADGKNGFLSKETLETLLPGRTLIALDGAGEILRELSIVPDAILGDMDTISRATLEFFRNLGVEILPRPDQNFSDLEKALFYCRKQGAKSIVVTNATAGRFDHSIANIFFLKKYYSPEIYTCIFDNGSIVTYVEDLEFTIRSMAGCKCGFFGAPHGEISSRGLKYELDNFSLILGTSESIANEFERDEIELTVGGQCLLTFEFHGKFPLTPQFGSI
jgi:thiamine pyrophosphokinase